MGYGTKDENDFRESLSKKHVRLSLMHFISNELTKWNAT